MYFIYFQYSSNVIAVAISYKINIRNVAHLIKEMLKTRYIKIK